MQTSLKGREEEGERQRGREGDRERGREGERERRRVRRERGKCLGRKKEEKGRYILNHFITCMHLF